MQVVRLLPELRPAMHFLWANRHAWHERWLAEVAADDTRSDTEKALEYVRTGRGVRVRHTCSAAEK